MSNKNWPEFWPVKLGKLEIGLPLVRSDNGFQIYAFDPMGRGAWNLAAAKALEEKLAHYEFDILLAAESKSIALAEQLAHVLGQEDYVVLRKARKLYMLDPMVMDVKSITTEAKQQFFLGRDQQDLLRGKRVCILDDVISTGGTLRAVCGMAKALDAEVTVIACVLTEETPLQFFDEIPVVNLDHIPLPAFSDMIPE